MCSDRSADIGLIGLAVMGKNLVLNMLDKGFKVCVFNRTVSKVDDFLAEEKTRSNLYGAHDMKEFISYLSKPRKIILLVQAGQPVDAFIEILIPLLEAGDIIIDGGNSAFLDTARRCKNLERHGLLYVGSGVSGGEEGARHGPSLMPGGNKDAWPHIKKIFQTIAAKAPSGEPCCDWAGSEGAGHFVKMVHNGIEYGDMQLISEAYHLLSKYLHLTSVEMVQVFHSWNEGDLESYLIDITKDILSFVDGNGAHILENIRDVSGQKGTGKWTTICGLECGCPISLIAESVFARTLSSMKQERVEASKVLPGPAAVNHFSQYASMSFTDKKPFIEEIRQALYASKIVSYTQGFMLLQKAQTEYGYELNLGSIALMWRGGCIIRSRFLEDIKAAFSKNPNLKNLLMDSKFKIIVQQCQDSWRSIVSKGALSGIPLPGISSALAFYDSIRSEWLPANLIQAQRDYFGAHQYELKDAPGKWYHTDWTGHGGQTTSSTYQA